MAFTEKLRSVTNSTALPDESGSNDASPGDTASTSSADPNSSTTSGMATSMSDSSTSAASSPNLPPNVVQLPHHQLLEMGVVCFVDTEDKQEQSTVCGLCA